MYVCLIHYGKVVRVPDDWAFFIVDPATNSQGIQMKQEYGEESVWLLYVQAQQILHMVYA